MDLMLGQLKTNSCFWSGYSGTWREWSLFLCSKIFVYYENTCIVRGKCFGMDIPCQPEENDMAAGLQSNHGASNTSMVQPNVQ
jgi:hypothetical protein